MSAGTGYAIGQNVSNAITGENKPIDPYSGFLQSSAVPEIVQTETKKIIEEKFPGWEGDVLGFLYDVGYSTGNSIIAAGFNTVVPGSGLVILSLESASSTIYDASKRGASAGQALEVGILAGLAEAAFEKLPM